MLKIQQFNSYRQLKYSGVGIGGKPMPSYTMRPEMSPISETNKFLMSTAAAQDGSTSGYDDATRRDSIFPSEIDGGEDQQTQTAFEPFQTNLDYFNQTNNPEMKAIPQKTFQFNDNNKN